MSLSILMGKIEFGAKNCILPVRYDFQIHACDEQLQEKDLRSASSKHIQKSKHPTVYTNCVKRMGF